MPQEQLWKYKYEIPLQREGGFFLLAVLLIVLIVLVVVLLIVLLVVLLIVFHVVVPPKHCFAVIRTVSFSTDVAFMQTG